MAAEPSRLETLRRRVQQDPASFAFAALAEEYRRCGQLDDAVATCRKGLDLHPSYTAGRVTLARALTALGNLDEARVEFEEVLKAAPENLAARRGFGEVQRETGDLAGALDTFRLAVALAPQDPELAQCVASLERDLAAAAPVIPHGAPAPAGDAPPREPSFELQVVGSAPFPGDADLMISTGETGTSTNGEVEPAGRFTLVPDADEPLAAPAWLDAWDFERPVEAVGDAPVEAVGDEPVEAVGDAAVEAVGDAALEADAVRDVGEDPGSAPGGDPVGVGDVAAACPQPAVPEHVPEVRADTGPGDVAPAEPWLAEPAPFPLIEPDTELTAPAAADEWWSIPISDTDPPAAVADVAMSVLFIEAQPTALETEPPASAAADEPSPVLFFDPHPAAPTEEPGLDLPLQPESRGLSLGFDIPPAEILVLPDRGSALADEDGPPDPRLDALETFLDAIVRARARE